MSNNFFKALQLAIIQHDGQRDRSDRPYILHPVTVASYLDNETDQIVGLLHDTVEDTDLSVDIIRQEFGDEIADAVDILTHDKNVPYEDYIEKITTNPIAVRVKLADLKHNMQLDRIENPTAKDYERLEKYRKAKARLEDGGSL